MSNAVVGVGILISIVLAGGSLALYLHHGIGWMEDVFAYASVATMALMMLGAGTWNERNGSQGW